MSAPDVAGYVDKILSFGIQEVVEAKGRLRSADAKIRGVHTDRAAVSRRGCWWPNGTASPGHWPVAGPQCHERMSSVGDQDGKGQEMLLCEGSWREEQLQFALPSVFQFLARARSPMSSSELFSLAFSGLEGMS